MARKTKKKKEKHILGKKEFIFNFLSLIFMISVGVYFGYRSLYYYSKQNQKIAKDASTLNGSIVQNNRIAMELEEGLHQDTDGYYFKGNVSNNYVVFGNQTFRVIRINSDNSVRVIADNLVGVFPWGENNAYENSNAEIWLNKGEEIYSGIYYYTLPNPEKYLTLTTYKEDVMEDDKITSLDEEKKVAVSTLTASDYVMANGKTSYLNINQIFFLIGETADKEKLYVLEDGSVQAGESISGMGIRPVITFKPDTTISGGSGTKEDPYVVATDETIYVDRYVKMGDDVWKIFYKNDKQLKLYLNGYIMGPGGEYTRPFSQMNSFFLLDDTTNVGYYLNNQYLHSLPYQGILQDFTSYTGEISEDQGYNYANIYSSSVTAKVGLLNVFDYISKPDLNNFFYITKGSHVGSMMYTRYSIGLLGECDMTDAKRLTPVVSISTDSIKGGKGSLEDPYVVEG